MRNKRIDFRLTEEEYVYILVKSKQVGSSMTDFILSKVMDRTDARFRNLIVQSVNKEFRHYGQVENNINQIARIVNAEKTVRPELMREFLDLLRQTINLRVKHNEDTRELIKMLSKNDRHSF